MNPLKLFRKFIKMVRGGAAPWQIIVSCLLGVVIGMIPGFNALVLSLLILFAIINLSLGLMLIGVVVGKALCLAIAAVTFETGYFIIHQMGLEGLFASASQTPFVALMDLDVYCLVGGLPIAIIVGLILGWVIAKTIKLVRIGSIAAGAKSAKVQKISSNIIVRILLRILFGKQKKSMAEMLAARHPVIRKAGVVLVIIIIGLVVGFEMLFLNNLTRSAMVDGLEASVGAEVNLKTVDLSLTGGRFELDGLQITDPDKPTHNMLNINKLTTDISIANLLTKRIVIEELVIGEMVNGAKRDKTGEVYRKPEREKEEDTPVTLSDYFEHKDQILDYLAKIKDYLENQDKKRKDPAERTPEETRERADEMAANRGYLKVSAASLLTKRPMITIRSIRIDKLPIPNIGDCTVEIKELSSDLALNEKPMTLSIKNEKTKFNVFGTLDFVNPGAMHTLKVNAPNLPVAAMGITDKCPLDISEALADLKFDGKFNPNKIAFPIELKLHGMKAAAGGDRTVLGLDAKTADEMFKNVDNMMLAADIRGSVASPEVHVNVGKTVAGLKDALIAAGKTALANKATEHLKKFLPSGLPIDPGAIIKDPGSIIKDPGSILKGKTPTTNPLDILKGATDLIPKKDGDKPKENPLDILKGATDLIPKKDGDKPKQPTTKPKDPVGNLLERL
ncbi:MAG: hypothetical protein QGH60_14300 [Phycisphaerae bacterium]|nr:hypothetical protein [Phycisphaerae bacterium]